MSAAKRQRELNRAKKEHENAKLSAQIATGNVVLTNIAESVMAKLIERQAAQIEIMREGFTNIMVNTCEKFPGQRTLQIMEICNKSLSATPDQALEQFAAKVRDQCAEVCESEYPYTVFHTDQRAAINCAAAIRAIKELP